MPIEWERQGDLFFRMAQAITERGDPEASYRAIIEVTAEAFGADSGSLALRLPETGDVQVVAALKPSPGQIGRILKGGEGVLGWVVSHGEPLLLHGDASGDGRFQGLSQERRRPGSAICWPIFSGDQAIGALSLNREGEAEPFSDAEFQQGQELLRIAAVGVENLVAQARQARQMEQLEGLVEAQRALQGFDHGDAAQGEDGATLYATMAEHLARLLGARFAAVAVHHPEEGLRAFVPAGADPLDEAARERLWADPGLIGGLLREPRAERLADVAAASGGKALPAGHPAITTLVAQPLRRGDRIFGLLYAGDRRDGLPFDAQDQTYLSMFAAQCVSLLERLELVASLEERAEDLHRQLLTSVKVFTNLLELRSPRLAGHAGRVAEAAVAVGSRLGLAEEDLEALQIAARLHDVGKLALPDNILRKPYSLLHSGDRKRMREHPLLGEANLMALESLDRSARLIRHHHEYLDGSGYPDGLKGEAIPLGSRILAVVNEYDDLLEGALFVRRIPPQQALAYLAERAGTHYDPAAVAALAEYLGMPEAVAESGERVGQAASAGGEGGRSQPRSGGRQGAPAAPPPEAGEQGVAGAAEVGPEEAGAPMRTLESARLQEGMTLASDLVTEEGMLLLSSGYVLDEALIRKIRYFERRLGRRFQVSVLDERGRTEG
jgi:GAF domain-containing protein